MSATQYELHTSADPTVTRIIPELAAEIGLNESIMLLQIAYWIKAANHEHDGDFWTYQSVRDMQKKAFAYWSIATVNRTIQLLLDKRLLKARDDLNQRRGDKTRWFALNIEALRLLKSISIVEVAPAKPVRKSNRVSHFETPLYQNETGASQNETPPFQNETTLPETPTKTSSETPTEKPPSPSLTGEPEPQPRTADDDDDLQPIHPTEAKSSEGQNIFALYAENIGALTPLLRDHLTDALGEFGEEAVRAAIRAAVEYNARHWAYVKACLDGLKGKKVTEQVNRYTSGEFADWVMH